MVRHPVSCADGDVGAHRRAPRSLYAVPLALGFDAGGASAQVAALLAALLVALLLTRTERRWPEVQEAMIGVLFVMAATLGVLLLASNVHGS